MLRKKSLLALITAAAIGLTGLAACGGGGDEGTATVDGGTTGTANVTPGTGDQDGDREFVSFTWYFNYDWFTHQPWGEDLTSAYWGEKFQIHAYTDSPDATPMEVLNLMIIADDLPDVIWMDRNAQNVEMTRLGLFYSIPELVDMVDNNWYHENVPAATQNFYMVDGVNHVIPNWVRQGAVGELGVATGGNYAWMVTTNVHEAVGAPEFVTFEDLFDYAVAVRDADLVNHTGAPIIPVLFNGGPNQGQGFVNAIYRSLGGNTTGWADWYGVKPDGENFGSRWDNWVWREAALEANRWHREGLFPATNLTNSQEQFLENFSSGRGGLVMHDHSGDNSHGFRRILREADPGNSIEVIRHQIGNDIFLFPPARGLPHDAINSDTHGSLGWNGSFITRSAEHPGRIFELLTWMLTPRGSVEMMFGPQGELWDELTPEGFPILHTFPEALSPADHERIGIWRWNVHGHSNHVDNAKFAANQMMPEEYRNWVDLMQETLFTPRQRISDELAVIALTIDSTEPLGIQRQTLTDFFEEMLPQIILASSEAEAAQLFDTVVEFGFANGLREIEERYHERWVYNKAQQGGGVFRPTQLQR